MQSPAEVARKVFIIHKNWVLIEASTLGLTAITFLEDQEQPADIPGNPAQEQVLTRCAQQLTEYYQGSRRVFDLPIDWSILPPFRRLALQATARIPYGSVITYGALAKAAGNAAAARAAGGALAHNPWGIVVPCHRVVGADGSLHGFSAPGGLDSKARLLRLEGVEIVDGRVHFNA